MTYSSRILAAPAVLLCTAALLDAHAARAESHGPGDAPPRADAQPERGAAVPVAELKTRLDALLGERASTRRTLVEALDRAGDPDAECEREVGAALAATVRCCNLAFALGGRLEGDERRAFAARMVGELESEVAFYDERVREGAALRLRYELGRMHALAGDADRACGEGFDLVIDAPHGHPTSEWIETIRFFAFYMKAKTLLDAGRFDEAAAAVGEMLFCFPRALDLDQGNAAALIRAEALARKAEPDLAGAARAALRVVEHAKGGWPNNARRLIARLDIARPGRRGGEGRVPPMAYLQGAIGDYQRALDLGEDDTQRQALFELAVAGFEAAISAARGADAPLRKRLVVSSKAWFDLGVCYSRMGLWYEASFAFEAVLTGFSKARVGRMLAGTGEFDRALARVRLELVRGAAPGFADGDPDEEYERLFDEAAGRPAWSEVLKPLDARLRKSAGNRMTAISNAVREGGWEHDRERFFETLPGADDVVPKDRELAFHLGLLLRQEAEGPAGRRRRRETVAKWTEAAERFLEAAGMRPARREFALHLAGECLFKATKATLVLAAKEPALRAEAKALGHRAWRAFAAFEREAAATGERDGEATPEEVAKRAERLRSAAEAKAGIEGEFGPPE